MQSRNAWLGYVNLPGCSRGWVKCCYFFSTQGEAKLQVTNTAQGQLLGISLDFLVWCLLLCPAFCEPDLFFWFVTKILFANAAVWKFTCWRGAVWGSVWMNNATFVVTAGFSGFVSIFLNHSTVCRQRGWDFAGWFTDGPSGEGFFLWLHSFLPSSSLPLHAKLLKMWWCFALPREITDLP